MPLNLAFNLPFADAIAAAKARGVVLPDTYYNDLQTEKRQQAFTVSGLTSLDQIQSIKDKLTAHLQTGGTLATFQKWAEQQNFDLPRHRLETIYRNGVQNAYNAGHWRRFEEGKEGRPMLMYDAINDGRTRPAHRALNGIIRPVDDQFWKTHSPPLGHRCRCRLRSLTTEQAEARSRDGNGLSKMETPEMKADSEGWGTKPTAWSEGLGKLEAEKIAKTTGAIRAAADDLLDNSVMKPQFIEAKTAKAAGEWAVKNNLTDFADYSGIKPEVANAFNRSLFDHLQEFPEMRKDMKFIGTCQAQFARWREFEIGRTIEVLRRANPQLPLDFDFKTHAEKYVKAKKVGNQYAHAWMHPDVQGIGVNKKFGSDFVLFEKSVANGAANGHFPFSNTTVKSVADHEFGHMLDHNLALNVDNDVIRAYTEATAKGMKSEVSGYAATNIQEFIAECWSESINSPAPREFAQRIAGIARARYQAKYP